VPKRRTKKKATASRSDPKLSKEGNGGSNATTPAKPKFGATLTVPTNKDVDEDEEEEDSSSGGGGGGGSVPQTPTNGMCVLRCYIVFCILLFL
jgi:hypothetical protein